MFRTITRMMGGGLIAMMMALFLIAMLILGALAFLVAIIAIPTFFLGAFLGTCASGYFYSMIAPHIKKKFKIEIPVQFKLNISDFVDAFSHRQGDVDDALKDAEIKRKEAMEKCMRMKRGLQSLNETYNSLIDKYTVKESFFRPREMLSSRIKKAALTTFKNPSFTKLTEELEEEKIKFEDFTL